MKKALSFIGLLLVVALVASASCMLTRMFFHSQRTTGTHEWIHEELGITKEQERALEPIETAFEQRKAILSQKIREANGELADVILADRQDSARVNAAIEKIHAAQGQLQMETVAHVFAMKTVLAPAQFERLLQLTADALRSNTEDSH